MTDYEAKEECGESISGTETTQCERDAEERVRDVMVRVALAIVAILLAVLCVVAMRFYGDGVKDLLNNDGGSGSLSGAVGNWTGVGNFTVPLLGNSTAGLDGTAMGNQTVVTFNHTRSDGLDAVEELYSGIQRQIA